jgi:LysM repeat protein
MDRDCLFTRLKLVSLLLLIALTASACYKNAGENVQPTSNHVMPTQTMPPTQPSSNTPTNEAADAPTSTTVTLAPTITPPGAVEEPAATDEPAATPTDMPLSPAPSFTPADVIETPAEPVITTPGMSDIEPSSTPSQTLDPALQPTPTGIPADDNPCVHVVQGGDTLYSIAQINGVLLSDLVAANPTLLGGSENTSLQIGWELRIPGCVEATPEAAPTVTGGEPIEGGITDEQPPTPAGSPTTHIVQPGDTVFSIAQQYGVTVDAIIAANDLIVQGNVVYITEGQELVIPPAE